MMKNSDSDLRQRYLRHLLIPEIGELGQKKISESKVLCVGAGGLGSSNLLYLAAAGVGRIGVIDQDLVDLSNLQRQVLFTSNDIGQRKVEKAKARLLALNPNIEVEAYFDTFNPSNAESLLGEYDAIIDGTDNFASRYLVNAVSVKLKKPNFFACVYRFSGQVTSFLGDRGCYRCIFPMPPSDVLAPDCASAGVLGLLPGIMGMYQALEFIKWKVGIGNNLFGKIMLFDLLGNDFRTLEYKKSPNCQTCGNPESIDLFREFSSAVGVCSAGDPATVAFQEIDVVELFENLKLETRRFRLIDVRDQDEYDLGNLGGTLLPLEHLEVLHERILPNKNEPLIVYCRSGIRSGRACRKLLELGYTNVKNVTGGILAWRAQIDPEIKV